MPRGAHKDRAITKLLRENGLLLDKRSFVSLGAEPHLYLRGEDIVAQRMRAWVASRGKCGICGSPLFYQDYEMDHIQGGIVLRCDCLHNLRAVHGPCHRKRHLQVQLKSIPMEVEP